MIVENLYYHEPFEDKIGILRGGLEFIPTQTFQKQEFLNCQLVANSEGKKNKIINLPNWQPNSN